MCIFCSSDGVMVEFRSPIFGNLNPTHRRVYLQLDQTAHFSVLSKDLTARCCLSARHSGVDDIHSPHVALRPMTLLWWHP